MCTISLVPHPDAPNGFILTSNRDEAVSRQTMNPSTEIYKSKKLYFPKDQQAGGTWIGVSEIDRCVCLMNGAEEPHVRQATYRKSRGVVVKDFLAEKDLSKLFEDYPLSGIEPFTMIIVDWNNTMVFYELIWNAEDIKVTQLQYKEYIWSSSPLYPRETRALRRKWFDELKNTNGLNPESLLNFHHNAGEGDKDKDMIIDRGFLKTKSITQVFNSKTGLKFWHKNLLQNEVTDEFIQFNA
ncbi:NRDE family protein [Christiangramia salexigens]|uniref:NRDE family protein n=1 Tax=Christiangramia salexigens TaxID=1913577 RepID=A0A1L3J511_9FLAO|nr:NRDE family protein [Christiangramia salexigens]APG60215.1 hypothetical protein LPB144_07245 [Christiangramia salexigens]